MKSSTQVARRQGWCRKCQTRAPLTPSISDMRRAHAVMLELELSSSAEEYALHARISTQTWFLQAMELELIQSHMAQKPVLRGEVGCACVAREVSVERGGMGERGCARRLGG